MRDANQREHQPADDDVAQTGGLEPQEKPAGRTNVLSQLSTDGRTADGGGRESP